METFVKLLVGLLNFIIQAAILGLVALFLGFQAAVIFGLAVIIVDIAELSYKLDALKMGQQEAVIVPEEEEKKDG